MGWARWYRPAMLGLVLPLLALAAVTWANSYRAFSEAGALGIDYRTFLEVGERFLDSGSPYQPYQAHPYIAAPAVFRQPSDVPFLYPPPFALVCVALLAVPAVLWWAVPFGIVAWCLVRWRPAPWTWPLLALALTSPGLAAHVMVGGSTMWAVALVFAGLRWGWPAVLIVLKPSLVVGGGRGDGRGVAGDASALAALHRGDAQRDGPSVVVLAPGLRAVGRAARGVAWIKGGEPWTSVPCSRSR